MMTRQCRRRGEAFRLVSVLCAVVLSRTAVAQTAEGMRIWTDSSGRHKTEAAFVRAEADSVHLKLANGRVVSIPLARLSKEDRDYVAKSSESTTPATPPDAGALPQLRAASVVVWRQQGDRVTPTPGIVVRKEGDRAFVVLKGKTSSGLGSREPESFSVADGEGVASRVPAEWHSECAGGSMTVLVAPAGQLPDPLPPASAALPVRGRSVTLIGRQSKSGSLPSATRIQQTGTVHRVFRAVDGTVASIRIEAPPPMPTLGLAASEKGEFVGVVTREARLRSIMHSRRDPKPPRFHSMEPAAAFFARLAQPYRVHMSFAAKNEGADDRTLQFVVYVADPFEQIRNPRLRIRPRTKNTDYQTPRDENDPRMMLTEIEPLPLDRRRPDEDLTGVLAGDAQHGRHTTLVADHESTLGGDFSREGLFLQLVYETPDGKTHVETPMAISQSRRR